MAKRKREPLLVIIVNPEMIPLARERLTVGLLELRRKQIEAERLVALESGIKR